MNNFISAFTVSLTRLGLTAVASILLACALYPSAYADELKDISQMVDQGHSVAAIDKLNTYITSNPKNAQALFFKGVLLAELGQSDEAIKVFLDVTEKFPALPEPYNNLAVLYASKGQFDKARIALEAAIKTHPSYATAHDNLGDIYARMAAEAYDKALQLDSSNTHIQTKLSLIKDLFGTGNNTTLANNDPAKAGSVNRNSEIKPVSAKNSEVVVDKHTSNNPMKVDDNNLLTTIKNWSESWSDKNLDKYFASYSSNFKPAKGESRKSWEAQRRERITKPKKISVELSNISITPIDNNKAKVHFKQSYRAGNKPIYTSKTLLMTKSGDNWLIEQEIVAE